MNALISQLLGEKPHPIPPTARPGHAYGFLTGLKCPGCGRKNLTSNDFTIRGNGTRENQCKRCRGARSNELRRLKRAAKKLAATASTAIERAALRFQAWALRLQCHDQARLLATVRDVDTYCNLLRGWTASCDELRATLRRLDDLQHRVVP